MLTLKPAAPRFFAAFGLLALVGAVGLVSSRPARTAGGPIAVSVANTPLAVTTASGTPAEGFIEIGSPTNSVFNKLLYTVPAGKRLSVDTLTLFTGIIGDTSGYTGLIIHKDAAGNEISYFILSAGPGTGGLSGTTQAYHFQAGPGDTIVVDVLKAGTGPITQAVVSLSGTLADNH